MLIILWRQCILRTLWIRKHSGKQRWLSWGGTILQPPFSGGLGL